MARAPARGGRKATEDDLFAALRSNAARLILLFGPEETMAEDIARRLGAAMGPDAERIDIESAELKDDAGKLAGEAASLSLFGGTRWIRLRFNREEGLDAVEQLLASSNAVAPVIATAGNLTPASKLRKLIEGHPDALSLACYPAKPGEAAAFVGDLARAAGVRLDRALATRIAEATAGDRALARIEVEKLALYLDADPDQPQTAEPAHYAALSAEQAEENVGDLVAHTMGGNAKKLAAELTVARGLGLSEVRILKALQRRATTLASMAARLADGENREAVMRGVFWKEQDAVTRELQRWNPARLNQLIARLLEIERQVMESANIAPVLLERELIAIARMGQ